MNNSIKPIIFNLDDVKRKSEDGDKFACYILDRSYDSEENGAEQSFEKAMYWYEKGKELGDPRYAYGVGAYYYFGFGNVERDENKAFELIHDCAMQGHIPAIYDLGANFYYNGVGTEKNLRLSEYYLKMAVNAGLPRAKVKFEQYKDTYESEIEK